MPKIFSVRRVQMLVAWVLALLTTQTVFAGFGLGAHPLSRTTVSMWILGADGETPVLLVYFSGLPDWHKRRWQTKSEADGSGKTIHRLVSADVTLAIATSADRKTIWVQEQQFSAETDNVFVVHDTDRGAQVQRVVRLGRYNLNLEGEAPLSVRAIQIYPELKQKVSP